MHMLAAALFLLITAGSSLAQRRTFSPLDWLLTVPPKQFQQFSEFGYIALARGMKANGNVQAKQSKMQPRLPESTPFPCDVTQYRSPERPTSVHALRPGDIDVIGALGDSLSAGFGALALDVITVFLGNRGVSFSAGGDATWRTALTIPNILHEFNPALIGSSHGDVLSWQHSSQFNVAEGFAVSEDMPHQARLLVKRIRADSRVDFDNDWKMVTILVGPNDLCTHMCYSPPEVFFKKHVTNLLEALDILRDFLPRTFVNIIPAPNLYRIFKRMTRKPGMCDQVNVFECSCIYGARHTAKEMRLVDAYIERWKDWDLAIDSNPRYRNKTDFAVVVQPFTSDVVFPLRMTSSGRQVTDYSYLAPDCFHFSQKAHAIAANALWNNLLEPVGNKTQNWDAIPMTRFLCPTNQRPYLFTWANSNSTT